VTREFINPAVSHAGLGLCLRRHAVLKLSDLVVNAADESTKKTLEDSVVFYAMV